ncbi:MAG: TIGR02266 family protein, partial [Deltaproteobacteria bacterium]|nr:TIGR02266 family protein [Deltaproteobacteria bacterium]
MHTKDRRKHKTAVAHERRKGHERREHERVAVCLEVDYRSDDTFLFAYITDMSAMGIFIQTMTPKPPGTLLNLRFRTPEGKRLDVQGRVIWINQPHGADSINPGMGVQFVDLTQAERERIMALVRTFAYLSDDEEKIRGNS